MNIINNKIRKEADICIIGSGAAGTALAAALSSKAKNVILFARRSSIINAINKLHVNPLYLPAVRLRENIKAENINNINNFSCKILIIAVPSKAFASVIDLIAENINKYSIIASIVKGFVDEALTPYEFLLRKVGSSIVDDRYIALMGPAYALYLALNMPTVFIAASKNKLKVRELSKYFSQNIMLEYDHRIREVELASILKGVIALLTGYITGLNLGKNFTAYIFSKIFLEISILAEKIGIDKDIVLGPALLGDAVLTAFDIESRNMLQGFYFAKSNRDNACTSVLSEGYNNIKIIINIARKHNIVLPIIEELYESIYNKEKILKLLKNYYL